MFKKLSLLLFFFLLTFQAAMAGEGKSLTIIYTNDVIGEVEPCG